MFSPVFNGAFSPILPPPAHHCGNVTVLLIVNSMLCCFFILHLSLVCSTPPDHWGCLAGACCVLPLSEGPFPHPSEWNNIVSAVPCVLPFQDASSPPPAGDVRCTSISCAAVHGCRLFVSEICFSPHTPPRLSGEDVVVGCNNIVFFRFQGRLHPRPCPLLPFV